ncbi:MAG: helix-turn-helix domain-containing protein [Janthinobacterium lividum]
MEKTLGQQLTELRESKGLTQDELAVKSGISRPQISRLENDDVDVPRRSTLAKLTSALDVPSTALHIPLQAGNRKVADVESETLAQFENVILRERISEQNEELNTKDEELTRLRALAAYLKAELGKFGGSLEAALHTVLPHAPSGRQVAMGV